MEQSTIVLRKQLNEIKRRKVHNKYHIRNCTPHLIDMTGWMEADLLEDLNDIVLFDKPIPLKLHSKRVCHTPVEVRRITFGERTLNEKQTECAFDIFDLI